MFGMYHYAYIKVYAAPWARATMNVKKPQNQMLSHIENLKVRFLFNKKQIILGLVTHLILRIAIVRNEC